MFPGRRPPFVLDGYFLDCETREPASAFVVALLLLLCSADDALPSIAFPVTLLVPAWDKALPAKLRCSADEFWLARLRPAVDATLLPVDFPAMSVLLNDFVKLLDAVLNMT
jgi:hypothetical protein